MTENETYKDIDALKALFKMWGLEFEEDKANNLIKLKQGKRGVTGHGGTSTVFEFNNDGSFYCVGVW